MRCATIDCESNVGTKNQNNVNCWTKKWKQNKMLEQSWKIEIRMVQIGGKKKDKKKEESFYVS
jgi:hypothetical protein